MEKAKLAVAANKGCIGRIKSLCIKGLFVVLHVGNMNIPLPPFLGDSRASRETGIFIFKELQKVLALLDCTVKDVAYVCADRSSTNRAAFALVDGDINEALQEESEDEGSDDDDDGDDDETLLHKYVRDNNLINAIFIEDSGVFKQQGGSLVVVECLAHAVHNAMKDLFKIKPLSEKWRVPWSARCFIVA
eukprot:PhM_4_TR8434/c4_g1_i7/m.4135